jgi:hypothetical protein
MKDKLGYPPLVIYLLVLVLLSMTYMFVLNELHVFSQIHVFLAMVGMGLVDNGINSFIDMFLSLEMETKISQFSAKNLIQNLTVGVIIVSLITSGI